MTIRFHDVSHHNGDYHPTGPTIAKASQGATFVDPRYATNKARTLAGDWSFAGYHWVESGHLSSMAAQAAHALAVIGRSTPMMADIEVQTTDTGHKFWPTFDEALDWCRRVLDDGGMLTLAYIPRWFWSGYWDGRSLAPFADLGLALISSQYTTYTDTGPGWAPYGGMTPDIWQYTSTPIDTNAFRGTTAELAKLFAGGGGAADVGVDMTDVTVTSISGAVLDAIAEHVAAKPINARPAGEQSDAGVTLAWAARQAYYRTNLLNTMSEQVTDILAQAQANGGGLTDLKAMVGQITTGATAAGITPAEVAAALRAGADSLAPATG